MTIDFLKGKSKAIALAQWYLTINNPPDSPNAYVIGRMMFFATLEIYETAIKTKRTTDELYRSWWSYFILKTLVDKTRKSDSLGLYHQFHDWQDFAQKTYIQRTDDFLPAGWPREKNMFCCAGLDSCQNLLEACISFSWTFSRFVDEHFKSIENLNPRKATITILRELNIAFDNLAKTLRDVYDANISSDLTKTCDDLLARELGLYVRQLGRGKQSEDIDSSKKTDKAGDTKKNTHSADFTSVCWNGENYQFNATQAECVKFLWQEHEKGTKTLREKTIGENIGSDNENFRLIHTFRDKKTKTKMHLAWGKMIISCGKGTYGLAD